MFFSFSFEQSNRPDAGQFMFCSIVEKIELVLCMYTYNIFVPRSFFPKYEGKVAIQSAYGPPVHTPSIRF